MAPVAIPVTEMSFPTRMVVGPAASERLPALVRELGCGRALVVSDRGLHRIGLVDEIISILTDGGISAEAYLGISKNPKEGDVLGGVEAFRNHGADVVIGLGGGAAMDVAKAIRLKVTHHRPLADYDDLKGGDKLITDDQPPMIAVPTTAGTGSEVGRASVICLGHDNHKVVIFAPSMMPNVAVLDARLTTGLPGPITAATGMDALTHSIEAYVAKGSHPFADLYALAGLARVMGHLPTAVAEPKDLRARHEMLLAASMGAIAFQKGLGACHALAHPLSSVADLHHGLANSIMLPHVMRFNMEDAEVMRRYATVGTAFGLDDRESFEARAEACLQRVVGLAQAIGLPPRLRDLGVRHEMIDEMVAQAIVDPCAPQNPRELTEDDAHALYLAAI